MKVGDIIKTQTISKYLEEEEYGFVTKEDETYFYVYWFEDKGYDRTTYRYYKKHDKETFIKVSE